MHMKRVLVVSDDATSRAWVVPGGRRPRRPARRGASRATCSKLLLDGERRSRRARRGQQPGGLGQVVEQAVSGGADLRLLVLVEPEGLQVLRLPVRIPSDFMVRGASSEELAARVRTLLWPGEEVARQELIRDRRAHAQPRHVSGDPRTARRSTSRTSSTRCSRSSSRIPVAPTRARCCFAECGGATTTVARARSTCTSGASAPRSATSCRGGSRRCATSGISGTGRRFSAAC